MAIYDRLKTRKNLEIFDGNLETWRFGWEPWASRLNLEHWQVCTLAYFSMVEGRYNLTRSPRHGPNKKAIFGLKNNILLLTPNIWCSGLRRQSLICCVRVISSPKKWVGRSVGTKIVGKMRSEPRQSVGTRIIGKMCSEHRFVRAARIIKRASCIMIFVTFRGCKKTVA